MAVTDVITQGVGLTFQAYPEAITLMPVPPLFNFLFFLMLVLLAMSSIVGMWEPTVAAVLDEFPSLRASSGRRSLIYIASCVFAFCGGLAMCFPSGIFMFNILNDHTASTVLYMSLLEILLVVFIFGIRNFLANIRDMEIWMPAVLKWFWVGAIQQNTIQHTTYNATQYTGGVLGAGDSRPRHHHHRVRVHGQGEGPARGLRVPLGGAGEAQIFFKLLIKYV